MKKISLLLSFFMLMALPVQAKDEVKRTETIKKTEKKGSLKDVSVEEAKKLWEAKKHVFIDVREDFEFEEVHIPEIKLINLGKLETELPKLSKDDKYVIICRSGARSMRASELMKNNGYNVINVKGGMLEWEKKGYPVKK